MYPNDPLVQISSKLLCEDFDMYGIKIREPFQGVVIGFVLLDCIFVIAELIVDLRITKGKFSLNV